MPIFQGLCFDCYLHLAIWIGSFVQNGLNLRLNIILQDYVVSQLMRYKENVWSVTKTIAFIIIVKFKNYLNWYDL